MIDTIQGQSYDIVVIEMENYLASHIISISRTDGLPDIPWSVKQEIKEKYAEGCQAVEIYPPQSDVIDKANIYHLWCLKTPLDICLSHLENINDFIVK